jgi:hypothetical protein
VPGIKTEITEITTGLAMLGYQDLDRALEVRPRHITHVTEATFDRLDAARAGHHFDRDFDIAWSNGTAFARSSLGLRGRPPWSLEWKGHHKPASKSIETIPADLRIDQVYLISCKYGSRILHNSGPVPLFDHCLAVSGPVPRSNWFETVCPDTFRQVWQPVYAAAGVDREVAPGNATVADRIAVEALLEVNPLDTSSVAYEAFVSEASQRTAARWRANIGGSRSRSELLWRLLRLQAAPYYVLGAHHDGTPMRYRVSTPWDFAQRFRLVDFSVAAGRRGQPSVDWRATVEDTSVSASAGTTHEVTGHVEVRWSHGKLNGSPEAKVYLDCAPELVPGYDPL